MLIGNVLASRWGTGMTLSTLSEETTTTLPAESVSRAEEQQPIKDCYRYLSRCSANLIFPSNADTKL